MLNDFEKKISELYDIIIQPIDSMYKLFAINNYKLYLNIGNDDTFGDYYYNIAKEKKLRGMVYTPLDIANYMISNTLKAEDIIKNPFLKIVDPSCGCGNLLIPCFLHIKKIYEDNLSHINELNNLSLTMDEVNNHIIENNLFGFDIDKFALKVLSVDLFYISQCIHTDNLINEDFLTYNFECKYNVFIGNPPYIGQKTIDRQYSLYIKKLYKDLYRDKGDLSYCFFGAALNNLLKGGKLTFITSRYFLESPSGISLRKTLKQFCTIDKIIDFYGVRPFKNIGIDPVIIFLTFGEGTEKIQVIKPLLNKEKEFARTIFQENDSGCSIFQINKNMLNDKGWVLRDEKEQTIINKIEKKCFTTLGNICSSYQGIITGCDKAFVVDETLIKEKKLEIDIIKPWIKSSFIQKNNVDRKNMYLIYSDLITDEKKYSNSIKHIGLFKDKLMQRRECRNGVRSWYQLQWGRVYSIFEGEKIVFPYKSNKNRFSLDKGSFFSADVYCLLLKESAPFTYEFLLQILNSKVYEYYFKSFAKKLGEDLYEYYPNNLMKLCMPTMMNITGNTDNFLYNFFEFDSSEISIMEQYVKN